MQERKEDTYYNFDNSTQQVPLTGFNQNQQTPNGNYNQPYNPQMPYQNAPYQNVTCQNAPYQNAPYQNSPYQNAPYPNGTYQKLPYMPQKKNSNKLLIPIIIIAFIAFFAIGYGVVSIAFPDTDNYIATFEQSGQMTDLINLCNAYDTNIMTITDTATAESYFEKALFDTKEFMRAFHQASCASQFTDENEAYNIFVADYFYLMIKNGNYDKFNYIFTDKMLEVSPTGDYYIDSYTFLNFYDEGYFEFTVDEKLAVLRGFEALVNNSTTEDERRMNLQEYYDFCESFELYDKADEVEKMLQGRDEV